MNEEQISQVLDVEDLKGWLRLVIERATELHGYLDPHFLTKAQIHVVKKNLRTIERYTRNALATARLFDPAPGDPICRT